MPKQLMGFFQFSVSMLNFAHVGFHSMRKVTETIQTIITPEDHRCYLLSAERNSERREKREK